MKKKFPFLALFWLLVFSLLQYWQITKIINQEATSITALWIVLNTLFIISAVIELQAFVGG